jgi:SWI/SNF-related matrix-associated actin-dependent regulator 1 of chromatin subfamily A
MTYLDIARAALADDETRAKPPSLREAVAALSYVCDGARSIDGAGFNKFDKDFGRQMAMIPQERWTDRQASAIHQMLRKYRAQLLGMGINYDQILAPISTPRVKVTEGASITIEDRTTRTLCLEWPYQHVHYDELYMACKAKLNGRWNPERKVWFATLSPSNINDMSHLLDLKHVTVEQEVRDFITETVAIWERNIRSSHASEGELEHIEGVNPDLAPFPFQRAGIAYALDKRSVLFADEMGLGKTIQALGVVQAKKAYPVLVICPASLKLNWKREWERWVPGTKVMIAGGRKPEPLFPEFFKGTDVLIINYDVLGAWVDILKRIPFEAIIADEAHMCKSYKSQRTKAAQTMFAHVGPSKIRLLLTGTPILNDPVEIWPLLKMIGLDKPFGSFRKFVNTYGDGYRNDLEGLNLVLRAEGMIRRRKEDVLKELPPLTWATVPIEISAHDRREYDRAEADLANFVANMKAKDSERRAQFGIVAKKRAVASLGEEADPKELKQLTATIYAELMEDYRNSEVNKVQSNEQMLKWNYLRQLAVDAKVDNCIKFVEDMVDQGEKVIVFGWHQRITRKIAEHFKSPTIIGGMKQEDIQRGKDIFQEDPNCMVIVLNIAAGGVGHTLTASSKVVFVEFGWNPAAMDQAAGRSHRIGQERAVTAYQLVVEDTIDADFIRLVQNKRVTVDAGTDGAAVEDSAGVMAELNAEIEARIARKKGVIIEKPLDAELVEFEREADRVLDEEKD